MLEAALPADRQISTQALAILVALAHMATRSKRAEADLYASLRHAGLAYEPADLERGLAELCEWHLLIRPVPLMDGGLLIVMSNEGMGMARRHAADEREFQVAEDELLSARCDAVAAGGVMRDVAELVPA